jgi:hypothetical protein
VINLVYSIPPADFGPVFLHWPSDRAPIGGNNDGPTLVGQVSATEEKTQFIREKSANGG